MIKLFTIIILRQRYKNICKNKKYFLFLHQFCSENVFFFTLSEHKM